MTAIEGVDGTVTGTVFSEPRTLDTMASPSSISTTAPRVTLDSSFAFDVAPPSCIFNGNNFSQWSHWVQAAARKYFITSAMVKGTAVKPCTEDIDDPISLSTITTAFKNNTHFFSRTAMPIYYNSQDPRYGTCSYAGIWIPEWVTDKFDIASARLEYSRMITSSGDPMIAENSYVDLPYGQLDPQPTKNFEDWLINRLNTNLHFERDKVFKARLEEFQTLLSLPNIQ